MMLTIPIFMPLARQLGFDPVWIGVVVLLSLELSTMTPPFGLLLFVMMGIAPPGTSLFTVARAVAPYIGFGIVLLGLLVAFPQITLFLPNLAARRAASGRSDDVRQRFVYITFFLEEHGVCAIVTGRSNEEKAMARAQRVAIIGAGLGGATAAALFEQAGHDVVVYEQAPSFDRLGAGIHLGPNAVKVMDRIGVADELIRTGVEPEHWVSRMWDTGDELFSLPLRSVSMERYGAPYLTVHRGDFHQLLIKALSPGILRYRKQLTGLDQSGSCVKLRFSDGTVEEADIVVGADGLNSLVREALLGPEEPIYTGVVGHRVLYPATLLDGYEIADFTKWWHDDKHIIVYYITHQRDEVYFVTGAPQAEWTAPNRWEYCSKEELSACFAGFHPEVQRLIDLSPEGSITKWGFFEREPLTLWSLGRVVLLGDACHPMKPHMGQGAAMAIEDAAMLFRCLEKTGLQDYRAGFRLYEANRKDRATLVQETSRSNRWLREPTDPSWVFGYDVFNVPLIEPEMSPA